MLSIFSTILSLGMLSICRIFTKNIWLQLFSIFSVFISGLLLFSVFPQAQTFVFGNAFYHKLQIIAIFIVWAIFLLLNKNKNFYFPLLLLPIINIALAPSIFISLTLYAMWLVISQKDRSIAIKLLISTFATAIFIMLFYLLQTGSEASGNFKINSIVEILLLDKLKPVKIIFGSIAIAISLYIIYFIPCVIAFFSNTKHKFIKILSVQKELYIYTIILFFSSLVIWSITNPITDSIQFFYLPSIIFINTLVFVLLCSVFVLIEQKKAKFAFYSFLIILVFANVLLYKTNKLVVYTNTKDYYSSEYLFNVQNKIIEYDNFNLVGANIKDSTELVGYWASVPYFGLENHFYLLFDGLNTVSLNTLYTSTNSLSTLDRERVQALIENADFTKFAIDYKKSKDSVSIEKLQYEFVMQNNIDYIILSPKAQLPDLFVNKVDTIFCDVISKQKFVFLQK